MATRSSKKPGSDEAWRKATKVVRQRHKGRGRRAIYPWEDWLDLKGKKSKKLDLVKGKDYLIRSFMLAQAFRNEAVKRGLTISVSVSADELSVSVTLRKGE